MARIDAVIAVKDVIVIYFKQTICIQTLHCIIRFISCDMTRIFTAIIHNEKVSLF